MSGETDDDRLTRWVEEHGRAVQGFLWARVRDRQVVEDLCQEVFARAWMGRSRYSEVGKERAYLLTIADRQACDYIRRNVKRRTDSLESDPIDGRLPTAFIDGPTELTIAMERLTPLQQRTLLLRYFGEMSFEEISRELACPLNTVLSHCRRGLEALRILMTEK